MAFQGRFGAGIVIAFGALLTFCWWVFVGGVLPVGERRFFWRAGHIAARASTACFAPPRALHAPHGLVMLVRDANFACGRYRGGPPVKLYSYLMVPISCRKPSTPCREAFRLSSSMMKGYKWRLLFAGPLLPGLVSA